MLYDRIDGVLSEKEIQESRDWVIQNRIDRNKRFEQEEIDWQLSNR